MFVCQPSFLVWQLEISFRHSDLWKSFISQKKICDFLLMRTSGSLLNLSRFIHCSVINVLWGFSTSVANLFKRQLSYYITLNHICQQLFSFSYNFFKKLFIVTLLSQATTHIEYHIRQLMSTIFSEKNWTIHIFK